MEDLIVIILTLIIVVVGALGQIKKKKLPQPEENKQNSSGGFWDLLQEMGEHEPQHTEVSVPKEPVINPEHEKNTQHYPFQPANEGKSDLKRSSAFKENLEKKQEKDAEKKISRSFSLRKAVIYSEILNRKYI
jgi:hypothetical protein